MLLMKLKHPRNSVVYKWYNPLGYLCEVSRAPWRYEVYALRDLNTSDREYYVVTLSQVPNPCHTPKQTMVWLTQALKEAFKAQYPLQMPEDICNHTARVAALIIHQDTFFRR